MHLAIYRLQILPTDSAKEPKQGIQPRIIKSFSNITAGCKNQPFFIVGNGSQLDKIFTTFFTSSSSLKDDDVFDPCCMEPISKILKVFLALGQQDGGSACFDGMQDIIEYHVVALSIHGKLPV